MKKSIFSSMLLAISIFFILGGTLQVSANPPMQQPQVKGLITDIDTGSPLQNVTIWVKGTAKGTKTAEDGTYAMELPEGSKTLIISCSGYLTLQVDIESRPEINIALTKDTSPESSSAWGLQ